MKVMTRQGIEIDCRVLSWETQGVMIDIGGATYFYPFSNIRWIKTKDVKKK